MVEQQESVGKCRHRRPAAEQPRTVGERIPSLPFFWWAIGLALVAGFGQGAALFFAVASGQPLALWWLAAVQAHGHVQLIGWAGMFALGVGLYFLPRLRGCPPPAPAAVRRAAQLLGVGLALRAIGQPLLALAASGPLGLAARAALGLSGLLELVGALLAVGALLRAARRGPPLASRAALVAVLPYMLAFFVALGLGLAMNALLMLEVAASGLALIPPVPAAELSHLGLIGMLVPISGGISARTFPLYLRLRVPPRGELTAIFAVLLVGFLLRAAGVGGLAGLEGLQPFGALLEGAALLGLVWVVDVPLRRTRRVPLGREGPPAPEIRPTTWLIVSAYGWLAVTGLLLVGQALGGWGLLPAPPLDAERHAIGAGFVTLLILGVAPRLLPGFAGRHLHSARLVWATVWLGNSAAVLRVAPLFLADSSLRAGLPGTAGLLDLAALVCLGWNLWKTVR
ncbi:MAG: NnrS family protein [Chloroflexi bacterium]|nr:NnrS family protein [Chloroflexota bacterium]